ncbi:MULTISPECIES: glycoside hydrolase family 43 protein [unclassified Parabacteroides]|uniref:glycoside hydrolase family 43 protein n=1 Tax=unclassified Parabacteroides TaxID=2649774 RepID=UPI0024735EBE|nr:MULTISPECIES: glycoside hydrolase family 43 protein [unclassified Parabacteroides]
MRTTTLLSLCLVLSSALFITSCEQAVQEEPVAYYDYLVYTGNDNFYNENPLSGKDQFYNPILPGWYSDPSICTNGEDYFLVTSSFAYFPGVPIFHSKDLVNWKQIGHVLDRPSQLTNMEGRGISRGIFAPAIEYNPHNQTYYMITTNVSAGNFFVKTKDPFGSWSDPIPLPEVGGIDPSFFFDEDGRAYIVNNDGMDGKELYEGHRSIRVREFDVATDKTIGPWKMIVNGGVNLAEKPIWIEGPHLYKIKGKYYLMAAEGGTSEEHSEVIFVSDSPMGEFKPWDKNPILTQRHLPGNRLNPITCAGHADLIQTKEGDWWAVFLACRPINNRFENLGRETFLMPVRWSDDGFPYMTRDEELIPMISQRKGVERAEEVTFGNFTRKDDFNESKLGMEWLTLRTPATDLYSLEKRPGHLALTCSPVKAAEMKTPAYVGRRMQHHQFTCETRMHFHPENEKQAAGMLLFKDETHHYFFALRKAANGHAISLIQVSDAGEKTLAEAPVKQGKFIDMKVVSTGLHYAFYYATQEGKWELLTDQVDARYLSTANAGGFTGSIIGLYATTDENE